MSTAALIRKLAEMGLNPNQMIELAEAFDKLSRLNRLPSVARPIEPTPRSCAA